MSSNLYSLSHIATPGTDWIFDCNSNREMNNPDLSQNRLRLVPRSTSKGCLAGTPAAPPWTVSVECSVAADTGRIFNALTVPEYMEAWICVPGHHPNCHNVTSHVDHGFQIDHLCNSGAHTRITGAYFSFLKRKLSFSWRPADEPSANGSFVDIRLYGDFERSVLRLRHSGFDTKEEFDWHAALWTASISRLCRLFDKPTVGADHRRSRAGSRRSKLSCAL
jgi:uncharacterized protein YndB with AHSA1/START domain